MGWLLDLGIANEDDMDEDEEMLTADELVPKAGKQGRVSEAGKTKCLQKEVCLILVT
jgi:hypothetical protein